MNRYIYRFKKTLWLLLAVFIRSLVKVKNNRVFCWSYNFNKYACNPRAITEFLLNYTDYEIYWAFNNNIDVKTANNNHNVFLKRYI